MSHAYNDDLFEDTKMTFGQHLEELRGVLFKSLFGLVIAFLLGLYFANDVVKFIQGPLTSALDTYYVDKAVLEMNEKYKGNAPPELIATILDSHLVRKTERMAPQSILSALQTAAPDSFQNAEFVPYRFVADDVNKKKECGNLCALLQTGGKKDGTPASLLWNLMDDDERDLVNRLAGQEEVSDEQRLAIIQILNRLADLGKEVYGSSEFQSVQRTNDKRTNETIKQLRENAAQLDEHQSRRLNRLLISAAFEEQIRRPQVMLVDVAVWQPTEVRVQSLSAQESFMIWLKAGFVAGLVFACPWIFWQVWSFVAAGLYPHEKRFVYVFLPVSILLFVAGVCLAFFMVFKPVLDFLFGFNRAMNIDPDPRIGEWLSFVLLLPLGFGIAFQLPVVMLFLNRLGIVKVEAFVKKWRIAILVIFVTSMFLTPADPISMMMMATPLTVLYFLGIVLCLWMPRFRRPMPEGYEPS